MSAIIDLSARREALHARAARMMETARRSEFLRAAHPAKHSDNLANTPRASVEEATRFALYMGFLEPATTRMATYDGFPADSEPAA